MYGDREREAQPSSEIDRLAALPRRLSSARGRLPRHETLVAAFIDAAELAQGLADTATNIDGQGPPSPAAAALALLRVLAGAVCQSLAGATTLRGFLPAFQARIDALSATPLPRRIRCRRQEGYAFYALYPEAYVEAARRMKGPVGAVIGIRSIGIGLAAITANTVAAPFLISVRPTGPPFQRVVRLPARTAQELRRMEGIVAVADEGPGLSGSSFAAVSDALSVAGVAVERQCFLPSHAGQPGPAAGEKVRAIWAQVPRHPAMADPVWEAHSSLGSLTDWCSDLTGSPTAPLTDLGPSWPPPSARAPRVPAFERRKFLLRTERGTFLLRFAGLGRYGTETLRRALWLSRAGWIPEVLGLRHGFLVERWIGDARALSEDEAGRAAFLAHLAAYLAFRHRHLPAAIGTGAPLEELAAMMVHNAREALGRDVPLQGRLERARQLEANVRRVQTDGRLHRWEWLVQPQGRFLKADGVDHCAGHDLIGCQDIGWDVAGATVEFDLTQGEVARLLSAMGKLGAFVDVKIIDFLKPCYLAFQIGLWHARATESSAMPEKQLYRSYVNKLRGEIFFKPLAPV